MSLLSRNSFYLLLFLLISFNVFSQESYEIQVYGSATQPVKSTIVELHSNFSLIGPDNVSNFTKPFHQTVEITTGITKNFEVGCYFFNRINTGNAKYSGSHIRPRFAVPSNWNWKFGASLSFEFGFVNENESNTTNYDFEIRPIFDKTINKHYISFNPTIDGSFNQNELSFSPNIKYAYSFTKKYSFGIEYYGNVGRPFNWDAGYLQTHQLFVVADLFLHPLYELSFGIGKGLTQSSDNLNLKLIFGRRIYWKKNKK